MIHTCEFYAILKKEVVGFLEERFNTKITLITEKIDTEKFNSVYFYFYKLYGVWRFNLVVDFIKLLNKSEISENDYEEIEKKLEKIIIYLFGDMSMYVETILKRIDFRKDVVIENKEERELLLKIYKKARKKVNKKEKNTKFDSTIYFSNSSVVVIIYDKTKEREAKNLIVNEYEKNILRLEIRLFPKHLTYKKKSAKIERTLKSYLKNDIFSEYIDKHALTILQRGNHYKIKIIESMLNDDDNIKAKDKKEIINFLNYISRYGFDSVINKLDENGKHKYSRYTCNKYMKILAELNINPLIIQSREVIDFIENKFCI